MTRHQSFFAYLALLVGVVTFASSFSRPTVGQGVVAPTVVGRYQVAAGGSGQPYIFVIDTATGMVWRTTISGQNWTDLGSPSATK